MMLAAEWSKQWHRPRTAVVLVAAALFPLLLASALSAAGAWHAERVGDIPLIIVPQRSGLAIPLVALSSTMRFFLPLMVAIIAGEIIAGEAAAGSLRYTLARPFSRTSFLGSKTLVAAALTAVVMIVFVVSSILVGLAFFGWHPLAIADGDPSSPGSTFTAITSWAALGRLGESVAFVAAGMSSVLAFGLLLSSVTSRPAVAVAGAAGLSVLSRVFNADYLPGVGGVSPYTPNNEIDLWQHLFVPSPDTSGMTRFLLLQAGYVAVFLGAAWWRFHRRDVLV